MAADRANAGEVILNGVAFPVKGPIRYANITVPANPVSFGDASKKGDTQAMSTQIQSSNTGGARIYKANSRTDTDRWWESTCETAVREALALPVKTYSMGKPAALTTEQVSLIFPHRNEEHFVFANKVYRWLDATQQWSALDRTLATNPTDWAAFNGNVYLAYGSGYDIKDAAGAWSTVATAASFFTVWDAKLWRLAQVGGLWTIFSMPAGGAWSAAAGTLPQNLTPSQMIVYRDAENSLVIYVLTNQGAYSYDATNQQFKETEIRWPGHQQRTRGTVFNDGKLYLAPVNLDVLAVTSGSQFVAQPVGLNLEDGVPTKWQGKIVDLRAEYNWIFVLVDASTQVAYTPTDSGLGEPFEPHQWPTVSGNTTLWKFSGAAWHVMWDAPTGNQPGTALDISSAYAKNRVYWGALGEGWYQDLQAGTFNPRQLTNTARDLGCSHTTPWFDMDTESQKKLFKGLQVRTYGTSATETVSVYYGLDKDDSTWYPLGTISTNGRHEFSINGTLGRAADYIRFRFDLTRGSDPTKTPVIEFWANEWMRLLPITPGFTFLVDLSREYGGHTPLHLFQLLQDYANNAVTTTLIPFTFQDMLTQEAATYYVSVSRVDAQLVAGRENRGEGQAQVAVIAPKYGDRTVGGV
jgi:hypothetical protein